MSPNESELCEEMTVAATEDALSGDATCRDFQCPVCSAPVGAPFFQMFDVPTMDGALCRSADESMNWPIGDVSLVFCDSCAYIGNIDFNPEKIQYGPYHFSLHHSAHFDEFVSQQVQRLLDVYSLENGRILDLGCGAGDFLKSFANATHIDGLGIDPGIDESSEVIVNGSKLRLQKKLFEPADGVFEPDLICVRHVVDALESPLGLMQSIRESIGDRDDCIVYCEVPNAMKYLANDVVWNLVYEHRSWFTTRCLHQLFAASGFEILSMYRCWSDEYLAIEARPSLRSSEGDNALRESTEVYRDVVGQFATSGIEQFRTWKERLAAWNQAGKKVAIWGAGARAITLLHQVDPDGTIEWVVDINPHRQGMFLPRVPVQVRSPESLVELKPDVVLISNPAFAEEIEKQAAEFGIDAEFQVL